MQLWKKPLYRLRLRLGRMYNIIIFAGVVIAPTMAHSQNNAHGSDLGDETPACPTNAEIQSESADKTFDARVGTSMIGIYPCWSANEGNDQYRYLSELYAHWTVREVRGNIGKVRRYSDEARPAIVRLFSGKNISVVSSVRIDLKDPNMTFFLPLSSFSYQGRVGKGEAWSTDLLSDDQSLPFFRISPTTSARIEVSADSTSEIEVKAASSVLTALRNLTSVVSPGGALVTTLNREGLQQTSNALDTALSNIWSEYRGERHVTGRQLSEWFQNADFLVQVEQPEFVKIASKNDIKSHMTRWYRLSLSCPRYSIFDTQHACAKVDYTRDNQSTGMLSNETAYQMRFLQNRITAQQVNNYLLAPGKTLRQHLSDQDWYSRFLRTTSSDNSEGAPPPPADPLSLPAPTTGVPAESMGDKPNVAVMPVLVTAPATAPNKKNGAGATEKKEKDASGTYAAFCHSLVDTLYAVGLSSLDARIGLWAMVTGSPDLVGIAPNFQRSGYCSALLPLRGVKVEGYSWNFATLS